MKPIDLRNAAFSALRAVFAPIMEESAAAQAAALAQLNAWADAHPGEFPGPAKSIQFPDGAIGYRTGQPQLKTQRGSTWEKVLAALKDINPALLAAEYIRVKEEVNKQKILSDREFIGPDVLARLGLKVIQEETFYIEPKLTHPPS